MIIGETPSERNERESVRDELNAKMWLMGNREFIDIFTTVPDYRTTDEILSRIPKCCIGHKPKPTKPLKLKPTPERDTSRAKQRHQEQI